MNVNTFFSGNNFTAGISHSYQRVIVRVDREDKFRINSGSLVSKLPIEIEILISSALSKELPFATFQPLCNICRTKGITFFGRDGEKV